MHADKRSGNVPAQSFRKLRLMSVIDPNTVHIPNTRRSVIPIESHNALYQSYLSQNSRDISGTVMTKYDFEGKPRVYLPSVHWERLCRSWFSLQTRVECADTPKHREPKQSFDS